MHLHQGPATGIQDTVIGGLRLLVQKWTKQDGILDPDVPVMPFLKPDFDQIMNRLCLPRSFPLDFVCCQQIPAEVETISTRFGDRLGWLPVRQYFGSILTTFLQQSLVKVLDSRLV